MRWEIKTLEELFLKGSSKLTLKAVKDSVGPFKVFGAKGLCGHSNQYDQEQRYFAVIKDGAGVGRISCHEPQSSVLGTMQYLIPKGHENFRFLHYALLNLKLSSFAVGSTIPHIYFKDYKGLNIGVPTFEEQERIVAVLDEAFAAIDKAKANIERNLTNARELFQSRLNDIFSNPSEDWEVKPLGEVCTVKGGKRLPKGRKLENGDNGHPYLTVSDFNDHGSVDMKEIKFVPLDVVPLIERYIIHTTDVYLSIAGTIGKTGIIPRALDGCNLTENAAKLSPNSELDTRFLYWFTRSPRFQNESGARTRTTAQPKLALTRVRSIPLMIPTMQEQSRIVKELDVFQEDLLELESTYSGQIDNLEELRQSILERAFEGKLTEPVAA